MQIKCTFHSFNYRDASKRSAHEERYSGRWHGFVICLSLPLDSPWVSNLPQYGPRAWCASVHMRLTISTRWNWTEKYLNSIWLRSYFVHWPRIVTHGLWANKSILEFIRIPPELYKHRPAPVCFCSFVGSSLAVTFPLPRVVGWVRRFIAPNRKAIVRLQDKCSERTARMMNAPLETRPRYGSTSPSRDAAVYILVSMNWNIKQHQLASSLLHCNYCAVDPRVSRFNLGVFPMAFTMCCRSLDFVRMWNHVRMILGDGFRHKEWFVDFFVVLGRMTTVNINQPGMVLHRQKQKQIGCCHWENTV